MKNASPSLIKQQKKPVTIQQVSIHPGNMLKIYVEFTQELESIAPSQIVPTTVQARL
jgi:hypothetical protein